MFANLVFALFLLLFLHPDFADAQPPQYNGRDKDFYTAMNRKKNPTNVCGDVDLRELTGQCTAVRDPTWGQARFAQFSYISESSSSEPAGRSLPSAREISNIIFDQSSQTFNSRGLNQLFVFFAQFIDHNFAATPLAENESLDIDVPTSDPMLKSRKLPFKRSVRASTTDGRSFRPINTLTSAVDLVGVYGPSAMRNNILRAFDVSGSTTGKLKVSAGNLLPLNSGGYVNSPDTSARFFLAGDHRSNEHPVLTSFHTIFLREHNTLADLIKKTVSSLPPRLVYEYARILNIAQFQKIIVEEFYPAIVGKSLPPYTGFKPDVNPTLSDVFSTAAFRFGHTMVGNTISRRSATGQLSPLQTKEIFFRPASTFSSSELENIVRGTANALAEEVDAKVVDALRNFLFTDVQGEEGFDLVALNIQRGRDHALPKYNEIRVLFKLPKARTFKDITSDLDTADRLSRAYKGNVNNVEAFPGLLAEDKQRGSGFGRTMVAVWEAEFKRLRDGDQFYYERSSRFPPIIRNQLGDWLQKLNKKGGLTLKSIILRNTKIQESQLPKNIFLLSSAGDPAPPPAPSSDDSICTGLVCCPKSCGKCGGPMCDTFPGGYTNCCSGTILESNKKCSSKPKPPCIIQPITNEAPICDGETCCPQRCGECGGVGCDQRPGGIVNCCAGSITDSGRECSKTITSACILPVITDEKPICSDGACCPQRCGKCGGDGCNRRPGGHKNCCVGAIIDSGRKCSKKITSSCAL